MEGQKAQLVLLPVWRVAGSSLVVYSTSSPVGGVEARSPYSSCGGSGRRRAS